MGKLLITVGTTNFDNLIKQIDQKQIYQLFESYGFNEIEMQIGSGTHKPTQFKEIQDVKVNYFDFDPKILEKIKSADFIISHCGAGTILEALRLNKSLLAVINNSLMNNHQKELYDKLTQENYIFGLENITNLQIQVDYIIQLKDIFQKLQQNYLQVYPQPQQNIIQSIIDQL